MAPQSEGTACMRTRAVYGPPIRDSLHEAVYTKALIGPAFVAKADGPIGYDESNPMGVTSSVISILQCCLKTILLTTAFL